MTRGGEKGTILTYGRVFYIAKIEDPELATKVVGSAPRSARSAVARDRIRELLTAGDVIRAKYEDGGLVLGVFVIELPSRGALRALALAGFDFVVLDLEHSALGVEGLPVLIAEGQSLNLPTLVRVWSHDPGMIGKVLDMGATGVMVPHVRNRDEAYAIVSAARYSPRGKRGLSPLISYATAAVPQSELGDSVIVLLQIEGVEAIGEAATIAAVDGVDGVFVGPFDLSQSLGQAGVVESQEIVEAAMEVARSCDDGCIVGVYVDDPARSPIWAERGFRLQCVSFDGRILLDGATAVLRTASGVDRKDSE